MSGGLTAARKMATKNDTPLPTARGVGLWLMADWLCYTNQLVATSTTPRDRATPPACKFARCGPNILIVVMTLIKIEYSHGYIVLL